MVAVTAYRPLFTFWTLKRRKQAGVFVKAFMLLSISCIDLMLIQSKHGEEFIISQISIYFLFRIDLLMRCASLNKESH